MFKITAANHYRSAFTSALLNTPSNSPAFETLSPPHLSVGCTSTPGSLGTATHLLLPREEREEPLPVLFHHLLIVQSTGSPPQPHRQDEASPPREPIALQIRPPKNPQNHSSPLHPAPQKWEHKARVHPNDAKVPGPHPKQSPHACPPHPKVPLSSQRCHPLQFLSHL